MDFERHFLDNNIFLMQCSVSERLADEYGKAPDPFFGYADIIYDEEGNTELMQLYDEYASVARAYELPILLLTPTEHITEGGTHSPSRLEKVLADNIIQLRYFPASTATNAYIGGHMPRAQRLFSDGAQAEEYHSRTAALFAEAGADFLYSGAIDTVTEAVGIARAMENSGLPYIVAIRPTAEGRLADGSSIADTISITDGSVVRHPLCYMADGIEPKALYEALAKPFNNTAAVKKRFQGVKAASAPPRVSRDGTRRVVHPFMFEMDIHNLSDFINLKVIGGSHGTDSTHLEEIAKRL